MKRSIAMVLLYCFCFYVAVWAGEIPDAIKGIWVVTGYRFAGTSALSEKEAKAWIGKTMVVGTTCVSLAGTKISSPRVAHRVHDSHKYFIEEFRIKPSDVGFSAKKVHEYQIMHQDGKMWTEPGSWLLPLPNAEALTSWDGVFFVLKHKSATVAAALPDRYYVAEAALRYMLDRHSQSGSERDFYSAYIIEKGEFTAELVESFRNYHPPVTTNIEVSTESGGAVDKATGKPVKLWSVKVQEVHGDRAIAGVGWYSGNLAAGGHTIKLKRKSGKWVVTSETMNWIS